MIPQAALYLQIPVLRPVIGPMLDLRVARRVARVYE